MGPATSDSAGKISTGASQNCPNAPENIAREWHALYTRQITQKTKKYHDGILRLEFRGSNGRQVMLYDPSRKLLDSRFLKRDELVESGETVVFDAHLVDIGDTKEIAAVQHGLNVGVARYNSSFIGNKQSRSKNVGAQQIVQNVTQGIIREWSVLYTTQITQKAKKYHDGILRLTICLAHQKQVILLKEDGTVLNSKYLNSLVDVRTGITLELTNYLVEIGEARNSQAEPQNVASGKEPQNDASGKGLGSYARGSNVGKVKFSRSGTRNKPISDEPQNESSSGKGTASYSRSPSVEKIKFTGSGTGKKPFRDAHEILSTLKRPMALENLAPTKQICSSQPSDLFQFGLQEKLLGQKTPVPEFSKKNAVEAYEDIHGNLNVGNNGQVVSQSEVAQNVSNLGMTNFIDLDGEELLPANSTSSNIFNDLTASNTVNSKSDADYLGKSTTNLASCISGPQVSDIVILDLPEDTIAQSMSVQHDGLNANVHTKESHLLISAEGSKGSGCEIVSNSTDEKSNQFCAGTVGTNSSRDEGFTSALSSLSCPTSACPSDVKRESSRVLDGILKEQRHMDDLPSFDLGF